MEFITYASFSITSHMNGIAQIDPIPRFRIRDHWKHESCSSLTEGVSAEEKLNT